VHCPAIFKLKMMMDVNYQIESPSPPDATSSGASGMQPRAPRVGDEYQVDVPGCVSVELADVKYQPRAPRIGEEYQVDIPECVSASGMQPRAPRVGEEYQVDIPGCVSDVKYQDRPDALLVWEPSLHLPDAKVDEYVHLAKDHGYNMEQALCMLSWHNHDIGAALADLPKFTPFPDKWSLEDKVMFGEHRRSCHRIKQMHLLPFEKAAVSLPGPHQPSAFVTQLLDMVASTGSSDHEDHDNHEGHHDNHEGHHDNHEGNHEDHDNQEGHKGHDPATSSCDQEDSMSPLRNDDQVAQSLSSSPNHKQIGSLNHQAIEACSSPLQNDTVYYSPKQTPNHSQKLNFSNKTESGQFVYQTETDHSLDEIKSACSRNKRQKDSILKAKSSWKFFKSKSKGKFFKSRSKCTFFKSRLKCKIFKSNTIYK